MSKKGEQHPRSFGAAASYKIVSLLPWTEQQRQGRDAGDSPSESWGGLRVPPTFSKAKGRTLCSPLSFCIRSHLKKAVIRAMTGSAVPLPPVVRGAM